MNSTKYSKTIDKDVLNKFYLKMNIEADYGSNSVRRSSRNKVSKQNNDFVYNMDTIEDSYDYNSKMTKNK